MGARVATALDAPEVASGGPVVARRCWLVAPEEHRDGTVGLVLTGMLGFPWREPTLDAKCLETEPARHLGGPGEMERHHRVVPDPDCTCGIRAADPTADLPRPPRGRPFATGFVALTGRVLRHGGLLRAQRASIVGPLTLHLGRPPLALAPFLRTARPPRPLRVAVDAGSLRVRWGWGADRAADWLHRAAASLAARYHVEVLAS
ncbi:MAG TPA: hypothetical protein ENK55_06630 [Actinobacteria bacterium]|nr:hypothetical protein [Actinomycetota bacterium]